MARLAIDQNLAQFRLLGQFELEDKTACMGSVRRHAAIALAILLACCPCALALDPTLDISQYAHTGWKVREGFSKGYIGSIVQTADGYLWLGTEFGLLRFDGVRAIPWQPPANEHLPSNSISSLLAAGDGSLWIGTMKGLATWKDGKLTQHPELSGQHVFRVLEDRKGTIWAGAIGVPRGRLCAFQDDGVHCHGEDGSLGPGVIGLYEDSKGNLWVGVKDGVWRWKFGPPHFYPIPGSEDSIQAFGEDNDGALLISTRTGIRRLVGGRTEPYLIPGIAQQFQVERLLRDREGGLWIGTRDRGLIHVRQGKADAFRQSDGLSGNDVLRLFEDREGSIWVATLDGLDRFRDLAVSTFSVKQGLSNAVVGSVLASRDGSVWFSTNTALNRRNNGQIITYDRRQGELVGLVPGSLFQDTRGRVWVSTLGGVGYVENERFVPVSGVPGGMWMRSPRTPQGICGSPIKISDFFTSSREMWSARFHGRSCGATTTLPFSSAILSRGAYGSVFLTAVSHISPMGKYERRTQPLTGLARAVSATFDSIRTARYGPPPMAGSAD